MSTDKILEFCDHIKKKAIEPATKDSKLIISKARSEAEKIVKDANAEAALIIKTAKEKYDEILSSARSEAQVSVNMVISRIKDEIEEKLFKKHFDKSFSESYKGKDFLLPIAEAISKAINEEGVGANVSLAMSKSESLKKIREQIVNIAFESVDKLDMESFSLVKRKDKVFIDITEESFKSMFWPIIKNEIRKNVFGI